MSNSNQGEKLLQEALKRLESGDTAGSQDLLNQLLVSYPGHPEGLMRRGFLRMRLYDVEGALGDWEEAITREPALAKKFDTPELRASVESALQQIKAVSIDPTSAQYYILLGRAYAVFGRYALSLQAYTSALRISPEEIPAGLGSAGIYIKLGQTEQALQVLQKMLELHPNSALLCSRVGFTYLTLNSTAQAVRFLERACSLNPADWNSHLALAEVLIKQGRHEAAMARYQQTLQLEPNCSPALVGMAECCKELYRFEEAISYYQKAIAADPRDFKAMCHLGVLCIQLGGLDLGIESLQRARDLNPEDVEVYSSLAKAYQQKGDLGTAAEFYDKTVSLNPRDYFAAYNLGLIYRSQGRIDDAASAFGKAAALRPNDSQYQYQLARAVLELGRSRDGLEAARKAVSLNPHNKEIQLVYARACLASKLYNEATEACKTALHIDPNNLEAVLYQAQAQLELGLTSEAEAGFQNALKLAPQHSQALRGLGRVYLRSGHTQKSVECLQQSIEVEPDEPAAVYDLGLLFLSSKQPDRILESVESVLRRRNYDGRLTGPFLDNWLSFLQEKGVYEVGTNILEKFVERFPDQSKLLLCQTRWHVEWADIFRGRDDLVSARQTLQRLLKTQPNLREAQTLLKEIEGDLEQPQLRAPTTSTFSPMRTNDPEPAPPPGPPGGYSMVDPLANTQAPLGAHDSISDQPGPASVETETPFLLEEVEPQFPPIDSSIETETWQPTQSSPPSGEPTMSTALEGESSATRQPQRHLLQSIPGCKNVGEDPLQLSQRYLEFALQLEKAGWLKEAALILWDTSSQPESDESLELHSHRILQNWADRLEDEGRSEEARSLKGLIGVGNRESAPPPIPTSSRRRGADGPRALLEPPPPLDWDDLPPLPTQTEGTGFAAEPSPDTPEPAVSQPEASPAPEPAEEVPPAEAPPLAGEAVASSAPVDDISAWMKTISQEESLQAPDPNAASPALGSPIGGLRSPLGAPREMPPPAPLLEPEREPQSATVFEAVKPRPAEVATPPPEFEVHLTGSEDKETLLRLIRRHPEHKGVRAAVYRSFAEDMAGLVRIFRDLVQEDTDEAYHVLNLARAFAHSGSDSMAILQFRKYVKLEATSEGYRELGEAYERMGKGELAAQAFRRAEQLQEEEELDD